LISPQSKTIIMPQDNSNFYDIGNDIRLARPTVWALVLGIVLAVVLTLAVAFAAGPGVGILIGLLVLGLSFYVAYQVNCTVVGACHGLAWFLVIMYAVSAVAIGVSAALAAPAAAPKTPQELALAQAQAQAQAARARVQALSAAAAAANSMRRPPPQAGAYGSTADTNAQRQAYWRQLYGTRPA
jgi:predicted lipid-binding transport protein (Tim44 family)